MTIADILLFFPYCPSFTYMFFHHIVFASSTKTSIMTLFPATHFLKVGISIEDLTLDYRMETTES